MGVMTGWVTPVADDTFARLVVVSPHFDDAVLGCGRLIAQHAPATVITVTGGQRRDGYDRVTWWDALGGFQPGDDVVQTRRNEDKAALAVLGAQSTWLEFTDHQYDLPKPAMERPPVEVVADAIDARLDELDPTAVVIPFGLANPDHVLTHDAALLVIQRRLDACAWFGYAEAGYEHIPGIVAWRIGKLMKAGIWPTPAPIVADGFLEEKRAAMRCYATQIPALVDEWAYDVESHTRVVENYWRLAPPPEGWGPMPS